MLRKLGLILVTALLMVLALQGQTKAQSAVNLQADLSDLRSQVSQLRAQVSQLSQQRGYAAPAPTGTTTRRARSPELSDSQIIDRLATLAIEAKDRLTALETKVAQLERRFKP